MFNWTHGNNYQRNLNCNIISFIIHKHAFEYVMGFLPHTLNYALPMRRECWERFPRHRYRRKSQVSDPDMHHGTCVLHVPWCMSGSLTRGGGENVPGIPGACATHTFSYLARGPLHNVSYFVQSSGSHLLLHVIWQLCYSNGKHSCGNYECRWLLALMLPQCVLLKPCSDTLQSG